MEEVLILNKTLLNIELIIVIILQLVIVFLKRFTFLTKKDFTEKIVSFISNERYRKCVMTCAGINPICKNTYFQNRTV